MTDRDDKGRFKKGTVPNPKGRPKKATEQEYLDALYEIADIDRWKVILEAQMKRASRGDIQAFNAIANRILPILEKRQISGSDGGAIRIEIVDVTDESSDND